jgi:hypothetical protein
VTPAGTTPPSDDEPSRLFAELSSILTGDAALPEAAVHRHLLTLRAPAYATGLTQVLERFHQLQHAEGNLVEAVGQHLLGDAALGPFVKQVLMLWFTGQIPGTTSTNQDDYFEALMWSAIGAHPPGMSDAYFGHWRYPPDGGR